MRFEIYPSRYLCSVLDEMRQVHKNRNYSYLESLIDEVQLLGNRMEAALEDVKSLEELHSERKRLKNELKNLEDSVEVAKPNPKL